MTLSDSRRGRVERALLRHQVDRTPCFPLVDVVYTSAFAGTPLAAAQLDPVIHAGALCQCLDGLPIDGAYVNLCFSRAQAAGARFYDGRWGLLLDDCLEVEFEHNDVGGHPPVARGIARRSPNRSRRIVPSRQLISDLGDLRTMRNAFAHITSSTQTALESLAFRIFAAPRSEVCWPGPDGHRLFLSGLFCPSGPRIHDQKM